MRAIFTCGGTGGHIYPALAVAAELMRRDKKTEILFIGSDNGMEKGIITGRGFKFRAVCARPYVRRAIFRNLVNLVFNIKAVFDAKRLIKEFKPAFVYGTGGFVSFPVIFAANLQKVRTGIHEPNMYPGLANRWLAGWVNVITAGFAETLRFFPQEKTKVTGNPVRESIGRIKRPAGTKKFGLSSRARNILVMPGSRAARKINAVVMEALPELEKEVKNCALLWMCGAAEYDIISREIKSFKRIKIRLFKFIEDAPSAYAACDCAILRAGASTLSEIAAAGMPSLLVPYPHATDNHQEKNARVLEAQKLATVIRDAELTANWLVEAVKKLLSKKENSRIRAALKKTAQRNSAEKIVKILAGF
jgi:UDP-N-acetylglucosamine--N-acetylmuramyl-(pentapeptide) pyrophosphoryl-undecaprenol N-acetylglucosamine transferase